MPAELEHKHITNENAIEIPDIGKFEIIDGINETGCIDGRSSASGTPVPEYLAGIKMNKDIQTPLHHPGAARIPGASLGISLLVASTCPGIPAELAVEVVRKWEEQRGGHFVFHTADNQGNITSQTTGCGLADSVSDGVYEYLYRMPAARARAVRNYALRQFNNPESHGSMPVLLGKHKEKIAALVFSHSKTVDIGEDAFRFDAWRFGDMVEDLGIYAGSEGVRGLHTGLLRAAAYDHMNAALGLLAGNKKVFAIYPGESNPDKRVQQIGFIFPKRGLIRI